MIEFDKSKWNTGPDGISKVYGEIVKLTATEYQQWIQEIFCQGCNYEEYITYDEHIITINEYYKVYINLVPEKKMHGGSREGAGRKSKGLTEAFGCRMKAEHKEYLKKLSQERGVTVTEVLESIIDSFISQQN